MRVRYLAYHFRAQNSASLLSVPPWIDAPNLLPYDSSVTSGFRFDRNHRRLTLPARMRPEPEDDYSS